MNPEKKEPETISQPSVPGVPKPAEDPNKYLLNEEEARVAADAEKVDRDLARDPDPKMSQGQRDFFNNSATEAGEFALEEHRRDKSHPEELYPGEIEEHPAAEGLEAAEKPADEKTPVESGESEEQKKEAAFTALSDPKILDRGLIEVARLFKEATGRDLNEIVEAKVNEIVPVERDSEILEREQNELNGQNKFEAVLACWNRLSDDEKGKFNGGMMSTGFHDYLGRNQMAWKVKEEEFYAMINGGFCPEMAKTKGVFSKALTEIPLANEGGTLSFKDITKVKSWAQDQFFKNQGEAQRVANTEGASQKRMLELVKPGIIENVINEAVNTHEQEKKDRIINDQKTQIEQLKRELETAKKDKAPVKAEKVKRPPEKAERKPAKKAGKRGK